MREEPVRNMLIDRCLAAIKTPHVDRAVLRKICAKETWGILPAAELERVVDGVVHRLINPDLCYLAFKTETGDSDFERYRQWVRDGQKRAQQYALFQEA